MRAETLQILWDSVHILAHALINLCCPLWAAIIFYSSSSKQIYNIFDLGLKFLTRLWLDLSHLNEHRFRHNFQDYMNPLCSCSLELKDTSHYLLHYDHLHLYHQRIDLNSSVKSICDNFGPISDNNKNDVFIWYLSLWWKQGKKI